MGRLGTYLFQNRDRFDIFTLQMQDKGKEFLAIFQFIWFNC